MIIFPAIDIKDGKVVRLFQGDFNRVTEYSDDPTQMAQHWENEGAEWLHVVDLDGARTGNMANIEIIKKISNHVKIPVEVGGGIRSIKQIEELINAGIKRVILGTKAIDDDALLHQALNKWQNHIAVSVDCAQGLVTQRGWVEMTKIKGTDLAKKLESLNVKCIIFSDIQRDGTLGGPNIRGIEEMLKAVKINVIASGGISGVPDIRDLCKLKEQYPHLMGAITGRAIYEKDLDFKLALNMAQDYKHYKDIDLDAD